MFINISNHPSAKWSAAQLAAAKELGGGEIIDIPFPDVPPTAGERDVKRMAGLLIDKMATYFRDWDDAEESAALVQGEQSLCFWVISALERDQFPVYVATTERRTTENADGTKTVAFEFVQFRRVV